MLPELNGNWIPRAVSVGLPRPSSSICTPGTCASASHTVRTPVATSASPSSTLTMPGTKSRFIRVRVAIAVSCSSVAISSA